jgi:hypothetical protein
LPQAHRYPRSAPVREGHGTPDRLTVDEAALLPKAQAKLTAIESE